MPVSWTLEDASDARALEDDSKRRGSRLSSPSKSRVIIYCII